MANKIRSTLVVATILATVLLLINRLFIIEGVGVVGGVGPHSCPHLAAPRPSPASRQSAQACASRSSSWSSIRPATSSRDYSEQASHNKRSKKPRPLHEHSSKREDLDPNYTLNYEEPTNPQQRAHRPRAGPYASARTHSWPTSILKEQATAPQKPSTESSSWADESAEATAPPPTTNSECSSSQEA